MQNTETEKTTRTLEWFLAIVAAAACLAGTIRTWQVTFAPVPGSIAWAANPLPGLYLLEMLILSGAGAVGAFLGWVKALWAMAGAILAFSVMGAWSIGLAFLPTAVLFTLAAILATRRQRQNFMADVAVGIGAGIAQVSVMLIVIRIVASTAVF